MPDTLTPMYEAFNALTERDQRRFAAWAASQLGMALREADPDDGMAELDEG